LGVLPLRKEASRLSACYGTDAAIDEAISLLVAQECVRVVVSGGGRRSLLLERSAAARIHFTPEFAEGFVLGGLALTYSPIVQVSEFRLRVAKLWPRRRLAERLLHERVRLLRQRGLLVTHNYGSDVDMWYVSLPHDAALLEELLSQKK
jgi:hypothetical protein